MYAHHIRWHIKTDPRNKPAEEAILRVVLSAVLAAAFVCFSPIECAADDPDVARLVALVNSCPTGEELKHVTVHINKSGKARKIVVESKRKGTGDKRVEALIRQASFAGGVRERKIQLSFSANPKASRDRRIQ